MAIKIPISFVNDEQRTFFECTTRNQLASGGLGSGKTYILCLKVLVLAATFNNYRIVVVRNVFKTLRRTTMSTFYKICPPQLYSAEKGGRRSDIEGHLRLINGSEIFWIGIDSYSEQDLKGLETNSYAVDQAEELAENIYVHLDSRIDRWEIAEVPDNLLHLNFPLHPVTGKPKPPAYGMLACNPDSEFHWLWDRYHPDSHNRRPRHTFINFPSTSNPALSPETLEEMMSRDKSWVDRFVHGKWGIAGGAIHRIDDASIINPSPEFVNTILTKGTLYRVMDHGESSPTCVLWVAAYKNWHFIYREYYMPDTLISDHRENIAFLSGNEKYSQNLADPEIFRQKSQKFGGRWSTADDYKDPRIVDNEKNAPPIYWQPADNSESLCRSQVNEMLKIRPTVNHPITGEAGAPLLYFIQATDEYPNGCKFSISQTRGQRRTKVGEIDGRDIYDDVRDKKIPDHGYDPVRYYCASKVSSEEKLAIKDNPNSFLAMRKQVLTPQVRLASMPSNLYRV